MAVELSNKDLKPVFFDNDGSADDILALITLLTLDNCRITGISVSEGNCYLQSAILTIQRVFDLFSFHQTTIGVADSVGLHSFPDAWRMKSVDLASAVFFQQSVEPSSRFSTDEAVDFMANSLVSEPEKTIVVLTGPATNLVNALEKHPQIVEKIERVLWSAGAFLADGNAIAPDVDGSAEWNIFWDHVSAQKLLKSGLPIMMFPLDVSLQITIDNYFLFNLCNNGENGLGQICCNLIDFFEVSGKRKYFQALLPVMYLKYPELFQFENTSINIEQRGTSVGNIFRSSLGARIKYAKRVDDESFCELFVEQLNSHQQKMPIG
jgi:purine nucleosidase